MSTQPPPASELPPLDLSPEMLNLLPPPDACETHTPCVPPASQEPVLVDVEWTIPDSWHIMDLVDVADTEQ